VVLPKRDSFAISLPFLNTSSLSSPSTSLMKSHNFLLDLFIQCLSQRPTKRYLGAAITQRVSLDSRVMLKANLLENQLKSKLGLLLTSSK